MTGRHEVDIHIEPIKPVGPAARALQQQYKSLLAAAAKASAQAAKL